MDLAADLPSVDSPDGKEVFVPRSRSEWRGWLADRPERKEGLWVVFRKASSSRLAGPDYDDLVEEALCFGWIDSQARRVDDHRQMLWFSPRRRGSYWSASNKERVARLEAVGLMTDRGRQAIVEAQADGTWKTAEDVESLVIRPDLQAAFDAHPEALTTWDSLSASVKKQRLWWLYSAKQPDTRMKRIARLVEELTGGS